MATPHVAGLVALVQEQHSGWDYPQVINQVLATVRPVAFLLGVARRQDRRRGIFIESLGRPVPPYDSTGN